MQGSKSSFFDKKSKFSHHFDDGVSKHNASFKKRDKHHQARHNSNKDKAKSPF